VFSTKTKSCSCSNEPQTVSEACGTACQAAKATFTYDSTINKFCCYFPCDSSKVCKTSDELNMFIGGGTISSSIPSMKGGSSGSYECPATILASAPLCYTRVYTIRVLNTEENIVEKQRDIEDSAPPNDTQVLCLTTASNT